MTVGAGARIKGAFYAKDTPSISVVTGKPGNILKSEHIPDTMNVTTLQVILRDETQPGKTPLKESSPYISVIIKSFNEEDKISSCIESVLKAISGYSHEIILADSISTDSTIDIASKYPIKIVQLANTEDRSCGAAAQLGYQHCKGEYILLIDGDMELSLDFIPKALAELEQHSDLAGVSGLIIDKSIKTNADKHRADYYKSIQKPIDVVSLGGGGLYRRTCIESVEYFSHSHLAACEELELGVRLKSKGYRLERILNTFAYHTGHQETNLQSCRRKWRNGRLAAYGYFIKSAFGKPWLWLSLKHCWFLFVVPTVITISLAIGLATYSLKNSAIAFLTIWAAISIALAIKKRSPSIVAWGIIDWWLLFLASIKPIAKKKLRANKTIKSKIIKSL